MKVTFRRDGTTLEVQDDYVKGPLKIGAVVEIKSPDGTYQEAIITKLTDASWYTVVFDDGDEKTLRRSSLCLKGERHFAESETLDQLPLTNPEHFGTPVIGKKTNRGRRSNHIPDEESSTSSSDEDEEQDKAGDELLGKVVCVSLNIGDKKKGTWVPVLVVSPDCRDDIAVKKDFTLVRSFKDGKFFSVVKTDIRDIGDVSFKNDCIVKPALDYAMEFLRKKTIPATWKAEVKDESSGSETEDEETRDDDNSSEEEDEVEPFPDENENFLQQLYKFMEDRGTPINKRPVLGYRNLNLFKLFRLVHKLGGFSNIESGAVWKQVYQDLGIPVLNSAAGYNVKCAYKKYLYGFEEYCTSTNIIFQMDLPTKVAKSNEDNVMESNIPLKQKAESLGNLKDEHCEKNDVRNNIDKLPPEEKDFAGDTDVPCKSEREVKANDRIADEKIGVSEEGKIHQEQDSVGAEKKEETCLRKKEDDPMKSITEIKGEDIEEEEDLEMYSVCVKGHMRYEEPVKADKTIRPADKRVPKIKHRRKIKSKMETDPSECKSEKDENCSKQCRLFSRPLFQSCDLEESTFDSSESKNSGSGPLKPLEITSILNGLQATENSADDCETEKKTSITKSDMTTQTEGNCITGMEENYFRVSSKKNNLKHSAVKQEKESTDDTDSELETPRQNKFVKDFVVQINKSQSKGDKKKIIDCGKTLSSNLKDESNNSKETNNQFEVDTITSSSDEECTKAKGSFVKKSSSLDEKKTLQASSFYTSLTDMQDKRTKLLNYSEERLRTKDRKDVWSSIQGQWPKKTLKELFSDSDTEGAASPTHATQVDASLYSTQSNKDESKDLSAEVLQPFTDAIKFIPADEKPVEFYDKKVDFPSSGSNSVLNTPPTTPDSNLSLSEYQRTQSTIESLENVETNQEEVESMKSDTNSTIEVDSVSCELQDLQSEGNLSPTEFDASFSSSSSNHLETENKQKGKEEKNENAKMEKPLVLKGLRKTDTHRLFLNDSSLPASRNRVPRAGRNITRGRRRDVTILRPCSLDPSESDSAAVCAAPTGQKRHAEDNVDLMENCTVKRIKRNHTSATHKRKISHTSDSEDLSGGESLSKHQTSKSFSGVTSKQTKISLGLCTPGKYVKNRERESFQKEYNDCLPKLYKWSFQLSDLENMTSVERIAFLQEKLQELRKHYLSLKSEVASIDRRRRHSKKKERKSAVLSTMSSSPSSSSITAAVMLTLADPSLSTSTQNAMTVECR
ncbi:AT-rich interactive domain-containing protein 4B isoform X2 [Hyla sarda]|uniref:AT-rich interactive domain-containing protein 4B isoform X2 n=1 Tax=Hyla sarda TaxID=327740 RepID=UPI0024C28160|nr:AT-rich interactive domain-containing protein 4B isoform X2 [Hyla sarda]